MAINIVALTGRLTSDPELKTTPNGVSVCSFGIAVDQRVKAGEEKKAFFFSCVSWRQTAELVSKYFKKGSPIGIEGSLQSRSWTDKNGQKHTVTEILAEQITFIGKKADKPETAEKTETSTEAEDFSEIDILDDDLPF